MEEILESYSDSINDGLEWIKWRTSIIGQMLFLDELRQQQHLNKEKSSRQQRERQLEIEGSETK